MTSLQKNNAAAPATKDNAGTFLRVPVAIWLAVIGLVSGGALGRVTGNTQAVVQPSAPFKNQDEEKSINKIVCEFGTVKPLADGKTIECSGTYDDSTFTPGEHPIWLAVEVNGHIWFKDSEIHFDTNDRSWKASISEAGGARSIRLLLFAATKEGNRQIHDWIKNSKANQDVYAELTSMQGTFRLDHYENVILNR